MYDNFPTPFSITVDRVPDEHGDGQTVLRATSPEYPGLSAVSKDGRAAVSDLMGDIDDVLRDIEDQAPLSPAMLDALRAAGHSSDVIRAWDWLMVGALRHHRYNVHAALEVLDEFASHGVPAALASRFMLVGVSVPEAGQIHAAGRAPEELLPYRRWSATDRWYRWDFDYVEWMLAGIPAERCLMYSKWCSSADAAAWEAVVSENNIAEDDIRDILRAGFTLQDFKVSVEDCTDTQLTLAEAERMKLALEGPLPSRQDHYGEPPF